MSAVSAKLRDMSKVRAPKPVALDALDERPLAARISDFIDRVYIGTPLNELRPQERAQ